MPSEAAQRQERASERSVYLEVDGWELRTLREALHYVGVPEIGFAPLMDKIERAIEEAREEGSKN